MADSTFRTILPALKAVDNGDGTYAMGVSIQGTVNAPTGRGATFVVAASNAPSHVKAQADYVCDGTSDNVEIQAAIDAIGAEGGTVQLSAGIFNVSDPGGDGAIKITSSGVTLRGISGATIVSFVGAGLAVRAGPSWADAFAGTRYYDLTIEGIRFEGDGADAENHLLYIIGQQNFNIRDCYFYEAGDEAIVLHVSEQFNITRNVFEDNGGGDVSGGALIAESKISDGVFAYNRVINLADRGGFGLDVRTAGQAEEENISFIGNEFIGGTIGLSFQALVTADAVIRNIPIIGNTFDGQTNRALNINPDTPGTILGLVVEGNTFVNSLTAIYIDEASDTLIQGNYFRGNTTDIDDNGIRTLMRSNTGLAEYAVPYKDYAGRHYVIPATEWEQVVVNGGTVTDELSHQELRTNAAANASALTRIRAPYLGLESNAYVDWEKKTWIQFPIHRSTPDSAEIVCYFQLKQTNAIGELGAKGVGIRVDNRAIKGISYGTALGVVDLGITMSYFHPYWIFIEHDPTRARIRWWIDGVLVGTQSTANNIPSGQGTSTALFVASIQNDAGGVDARFGHGIVEVWQEY